MHWLLYIHKILFSSTCFEPQVLIFRRINLYTWSIWYCHSLLEFVVAYRYTDWVRTKWSVKVVGGCLKTPTNNLPPLLSSHSNCALIGHDTHQQPSPSTQFSLKLCTDRPPRTLVESDSTICCMCTTVSSWRWALEARNM